MSAPGPLGPSPNAKQNLILVAIERAAEGIHLFRFARADGDVLPPAEPGAHIGLIVPNGVERQYSLIEPSAAPHSYTVGIKRDPAGRGGSSYIHDSLRVGQTVSVVMPRNNFPLSENVAQTVFFAGGIGITPIRSMVTRLDEIGRRWTLYYSCRQRAEAAFLEELESRANVRLHFDAEQGGVLPLARHVASVPAEAHLYCCGPAPMLAAFEEATRDRSAERIHVEYFTPRHQPDTRGGYVVELGRSGGVYPVGEGQTILQVLREAGLELPSSCEVGICGACETRVLAGEPDHRDSVLSEGEQRGGKIMMICCSGAKGDRLVLDL